ncbi:MAG TPA: hypothetical protein VGH20_11295 [Myxococcales bacterium]|jgi:hypothetical protein
MRFAFTRVLALVVAASVAGSSAAASADAGAPPSADSPAHFRWAVPDGWRTETIPFPLDFAPALKHRGFEELRFSPGMFKPGAPDFWSYAFVWWLEDERAPNNLASDLTTYFRGLCREVAKGKFDLDLSRIKTRLDGAAGRIDSYDCFKTGKPIVLELHVISKRCGNDTALAIALSPADRSAPIWTSLNDLTSKVTCPASPAR